MKPPASAIEMQIVELCVDPATELPIVILRSRGGNEFFSINVGGLEARAIAAELAKVGLERPLTHDLIKDILTTLGNRIERIEIARCKKHEYSATLHLVCEEGKLRVVEARPSDALALAVRCDAPIYVCKRAIAAAGKQGFEQLADGAFTKWKM